MGGIATVLTFALFLPFINPDDKADKAEDEKRAEDHRIVARHRRLEAEPAQPVEREDRLDDQAAREEHAIIFQN